MGSSSRQRHTMPSILVTGFAPFDGRQINSSWVAARSLPARLREWQISTLELPVEWGAPRAQLGELCRTAAPAIVLAMGEGRVGWFDIETIARNQRKERADNRGLMPPAPDSWPEGPPQREASIRADAIHAALAALGYPIRVSTDAGAFLCEETLYTIESLRLQYPALRTTLFMHLPPYGTTLSCAGREQTCDDQLLARFAADLLAIVCAEHAQGHPRNDTR